MRFLIVLTVLLAGCDPLPPPTEQTGDFEYRKARGLKREELFLKCLEIANVAQSSTHYADNAEVVDQCSSEAYYIANQIFPNPEAP